LNLERLKIDRQETVGQEREKAMAKDMLRDLCKKPPFCPIAVSGSHSNPRNIRYIPPVKIFAFLALEQY
jgi:hypothetical protein